MNILYEENTFGVKEGILVSSWETSPLVWRTDPELPSTLLIDCYQISQGHTSLEEVEGNLWWIFLHQATDPPCLIIWARVRWWVRSLGTVGGFILVSESSNPRYEDIVFWELIRRMQLLIWLPSCTISPSLCPIFLNNRLVRLHFH